MIEVGSIIFISIIARLQRWALWLRCCCGLFIILIIIAPRVFIRPPAERRAISIKVSFLANVDLANMHTNWECGKCKIWIRGGSFQLKYQLKHEAKGTWRNSNWLRSLEGIRPPVDRLQMVRQRATDSILGMQRRRSNIKIRTDSEWIDVWRLIAKGKSLNLLLIVVPTAAPSNYKPQRGQRAEQNDSRVRSPVAADWVVI